MSQEAVVESSGTAELEDNHILESKKRSEEHLDPDTSTQPSKRTKSTEIDDDIFNQLKEQIEFYFGEANYPTDKWMNLTAAEHEGCTI